ncbi:hypothetical protein RJ640_024061 [Escallonia rubra]|uniref:C2H2-type domain-containing protein n=1 Tax=Escallonia rubra TaxID=112253 RepID=A0AA88RWY1_9ASTE|nr:hypothetical protein RJ640_024061 [Escallonia rubra]
MEGQDEGKMGSKHYIQVMKGRRTKRPRPASPLALTMASSSCSTAGGSGGGGGGGASDNSYEFDGVTASPTNSVEFRKSTKVEEDMANCLILLAQGQSQKASESMVKGGLYVYECKTCNRCFSSFQALGGHRASHKRPKPAVEEKKPEVEKDRANNSTTSCTTLSLQIWSRDLSSSTNNKAKVHECSICGAEFTSGQALGGHMRRHRSMPNESQEVKRPRPLLSLDLNLPAPEDDHHRETKFPFASKEQVIVFSAPALVDCHY